MSVSPQLKRSIGFRDLALFYVVSGLSVRWTATAAAAGPSILVIWVAALTCFFVPLAACVMELSSRHPDEGGIYIWTREAFGEFSGFIAAWTYWMSNLPFFPAVLYFGAASALFAFGQRAQSSMTARPTSSPFLFSGSSSSRCSILWDWIGESGSTTSVLLGAFLPLGAIILLGAASYWRFGLAGNLASSSFIPHLSLKNAVFWSTVFFAFGGVEAGSAMGDEIKNPRRVVPWAILTGGSVLAIGYIAGTSALLVALPSDAVGGPDGFVKGIQILSDRMNLGWLLMPVAMLVSLNAVGSAAAYLSSTSRLPFVAGIHHYLPAAFRLDSPSLPHTLGSDCSLRACRASRWLCWARPEPPSAAHMTFLSAWQSSLTSCPICSCLPP